MRSVLGDYLKIVIYRGGGGLTVGWEGSTGRMNKFSANGRTSSRGLSPPAFPPVGKTLRNMENHKKQNTELSEKNLAMQTARHNFQIHLAISF